MESVLTFELRLKPQPTASPASVEGLVAEVVPIDVAQHAGEADVAPVVATPLERRREIGHRKAGDDVGQLDPVGVASLVTAGTRALERELQHVVALDRRPAELHVPEEHHAVGTPVIQLVREDVQVHERALGLSHQELAQLDVGMAQSQRSLPGVNAHPEEIEVDHGPGLAQLGGRMGLDPEPRLLHAEEELARHPEFVLEGRQPGGARRAEPITLDARVVEDGVDHDEPVEVQARLALAFLVLGNGARQRRERQHCGPQPDRA